MKGKEKKMNEEKKIEQMLTTEDIVMEGDKIKDFFEQIPDELKMFATKYFLIETVVWGTNDYYQALGVLEEMKNECREIYQRITEEDDEKQLEELEQIEGQRLESAYNVAFEYACSRELKLGDEKTFAVGERCRASFAGKDDNFAGGGKYDVFVEGEKHRFLCKQSFESHFKLLE